MYTQQMMVRVFNIVVFVVLAYVSIVNSADFEFKFMGKRGQSVTLILILVPFESMTDFLFQKENHYHTCVIQCTSYNNSILRCKL